MEPEWLGLFPAQVQESKGVLYRADDNWPFLYTREPRIPGLTWRGVVLTLLLSIGLWLLFGGKEALSAETGVKPAAGRCVSNPDPVRLSPPTADSADRTGAS